MENRPNTWLDIRTPIVVDVDGPAGLALWLELADYADRHGVLSF